VLFSGKSGIPDLIAQTSTKVVPGLLVVKAVGYAISMGCGFRGGPVFPAIFLGVALATLTEMWFGVSPTLAAARSCSSLPARQAASSSATSASTRAAISSRVARTSGSGRPAGSSRSQST
jgi:H+/Cl- antiporter ClcA